MQIAAMQQPIIVAGTGPAGLIASLAIAGLGYRVTLVGPAIGARDERTTALMTPALEFLDRIGVLDAARRGAAPLAAMRIVDATGRLLHSQPVTFRASEIGEPYFGLNFPNRDLNAALEQAVRATEEIEWVEQLVAEWRLGPNEAVAVLDDGRQVAAKLAVAADGRLSPARAAAGIAVRENRLPQSALVLSFGHSRPHGSISTEFHTRTGPFTQVPLAGDRSSLVWVVQPGEVDALQRMDDAELSRLVEDRMQSMLGRVTISGPRQVYPLTRSTPERFAANRVALVGEAAHIFPPIGAQGLNLGVRDVADLTGLLAGHPADPGSEGLLNAYDAKRRPDILARSAAVNLLNRSLLSDLLPTQMARFAGLSLLGGVSPLRALFMREGLRPGSGLRAAFEDLREQVRR